MDFTKWLERDGGSPREMTERKRIRSILGMEKNYRSDYTRPTTRLEACTATNRSDRLCHTFAATLLERGASLETVSALLGHKSIKITEKHYAAWVKGRQDKLEAEVRATWNDPKTNAKSATTRKNSGTRTAQQPRKLQKPHKIKVK